MKKGPERIREIKKIFKDCLTKGPEYEIDDERGEELEKELEELEYGYDKYLDAESEDQND